MPLPDQSQPQEQPPPMMHPPNMGGALMQR
jgi:hypothetical protein